MTLANPPKAFILLVALLCVTLLLALGKVSTDAGLPIITAIVFYAIGNGISSKSGKLSEPIIAPKEERQ
jgi:hypothetical protein